MPRTSRLLHYLGNLRSIQNWTRQTAAALMEYLPPSFRETHSLYVNRHSKDVALIASGATTAGRGAHRDIDIGPDTHRDMLLEQPDFLTVLYHVDDMKLTNGAVRFWKASHWLPDDTWIKNPKTKLTPFDYVDVCAKAGDVTVFNSRLVHKSLGRPQPGVDASVRRTLQFYIIKKDRSINIER